MKALILILFFPLLLNAQRYANWQTAVTEKGDTIYVQKFKQEGETFYYGVVKEERKDDMIYAETFQNHFLIFWKGCLQTKIRIKRK